VKGNSSSGSATAEPENARVAIANALKIMAWREFIDGFRLHIVRPLLSAKLRRSGFVDEMNMQR
jgi:hypothetical protein